MDDCRSMPAPEESQIESGEHQHDAGIRHQPFQKAVSEEGKIRADYDRYHGDKVERDGQLSSHCNINALSRGLLRQFRAIWRSGRESSNIRHARVVMLQAALSCHAAGEIDNDQTSCS
jgi:hypothetical protein